MYPVAGARRRRALIAAAAALGLVFIGSGPTASAYQVPDSAFTQGASGTGTMPGSSLTQTISTTGNTALLAATTVGARGTTAATYSPGLATTTPAQDIVVNTGDCASTGTCSNRGTVTIAFSQPVLNPILHVAGIGGVATQSSGGNPTAQSELHAIFTLTTAGVTLSKASTGNNFAVTGGDTITATNHDTGSSCISTSTGTSGPDAGATASCGSVQVTGLVTSLTFNVTAIFTKNQSLPPFNLRASGDGVSIVASVGQDFGDAPSSYDGSNAARAVLSNVKLGSAVSEDHQNVANSSTSPNAGASATGDSDDDGVTLTPLLTTATTYSATVALGGATKAGQVCGWIDFNRNGTFQPGERACAAVASGQTSATLTWSSLGGLIGGATYARFRVGYTTAQIQSPQGASDSGEVEDYPFTIVAPRPPTATPDAGTTKQNVNVTVSPLTNDSAGPGAVLVPTSVVLRDPVDGTFKKTVTIADQGTYTVQADGTVTFDPLPAFTGAATPVTYRVGDNAGQTATSTITITVTPVKPDAVNDSGTTPFETPITVGVLANDKPGHPSAPLVPASVCIVDGATCVKTLTTPQGTYTVNANGSITFDPADGYTGTTPPTTYQVADDNGTTDTATLVVTVPAPGKPTATPDTETTKQDVNVTVNPLTNDSAGTGATLVPGSVCLTSGDECVKTLTVPGEGTYTVQPNGTVVFDPLPAFTGEAKPVPYRVSDNAGQTATSTITITVTPVKPDAVNDTDTTPYNTPVTTNVLTNDNPGDPSAPLVPASVCIVDGAACAKTRTAPEGTYTVDPDGSIKFDPAPGFTGPTTPITYRVTDDNGSTDTATLIITVNLPAPPTAQPDTGTTPQNVHLTVDALGNDSASPGVALVPGSVVLRDPADGTFKKTVTVPGEGTYTVQADGKVVFDPLPQFTGTATSIGYRVTDSTGQTAESTIAITVAPVTPEAVSDSRTTPYQTPVTIPVLTNDKPGSDTTSLNPASVCIVDGTDCVKTLAVPGEGTYVVNPDGTVKFTPVNGFRGTTTSVTYEVKDSNGTPTRAQITVSVEAPAPPVANPDTNTTPQGQLVNTGVLGNDQAGPTGSPLDPGSVCLINGDNCEKTLTVAGEGTYTVKADGSVDLQPVPGFSGEAKPVDYRVTDGNGANASSKLTITVTPVKPDTVDDAATTPYDTNVTVPLLGNDNPGNPAVPLVPGSVCLVQGETCVKTLAVPGEGTYTVAPDGKVTFDPLPTFTGKATPQTYRVADENGTTATAVVTITVTPPPAPEAKPDTGTTPQNVNITVDPLTNDEAGTGTALVPASVCLVSGDECVKTLTVPGEGTYTVAPDGKVTFDPLPTFSGEAKPVPYRVTDSLGRNATSTITITVTPITPDAVDDTGKTPNDTPITVPVLGNDKPGAPTVPLVPASVCLVSGDECLKTRTIPGEGTYTVNPDGTIKFDPVPTFSGATTPITYRVTDENGTTATAKLTITVGEAPDADPDSGTTPQNVNITVDPLTNDTPGTGATLVPGSVCIVVADTCVKTHTVPGEGTYTVATDGKVTFDSVPSFTGTATPIAYEVKDSDGLTAMSTIGITVTPIKPTAVDDASTTPFETPVTVPVLANDKAGDPSAPLVPGSVKLKDPADGQFKATVTIPGEGTYTADPEGTITFTPVDGFEGVSTPITYEVEDGNGTTADALLTITVGDAPDANPDTATTKQNVNVMVDPLTNDKPGSGATLVPGSVEVFDEGTQTWGKTATVPGEGKYAVDPETGQITFDPDPGFTGRSSVPYRVSDSDKHTAASTVTITVDPIKPTATDDKATTSYNVPVTVPVATNDMAGDPSAPLVPSSVMLVDPGSGDPVSTLKVPGEGTFTVQPDGGIRFVPEQGFTGTTTPVTYRISDTNGTPTTAELTVTIGDKPVAVPDAKTTKQGVPVTIDPLANDKPGGGAELDPSTLCLISAGKCVQKLVVPGEGTYTVKDSKVVFDPIPGFTGKTTPVTYEVKDTDGNPTRSTITVTVTPIKPAAVDDVRKTPFNTAITVPVLGNDKAGDATAPLVPGSVCLITGTKCVKTLTVPGDGTYAVKNGKVTFTPMKGFTGTTRTPYRVTDANGTTTKATLVITVGKPGGAKAEPDSGNGRPAQPIVINPLANDKPSTGSKWKPGSVCLITSAGTCAKLVVVPDVGTWTVQKDGTVRFVSDPDYTGKARINYRVTDTDGVTVESRITVKIGDQPAPPPDDEEELPDTGGPSTLFFTLGALLVAMGGALLLMARKRRP